MKRPLIKTTLLDRVIGRISPAAGVRRLRSRAIWNAATGGYDGASRSRRSMAGWTTRSSDADTASLPDLPTLRDRSRDLIRNKDLAAGAINTKTANVIGTGLRLNSRIDAKFLGMTEEEASEWQSNTEREFRLWCESHDCDATRTQNFYGLQQLAFRSVFEAGDTFARMPYIDRGNAYSLAIDMIEADRCANPNGRPDTPRLAGGVERDDWGAPTKYHFLKQHPGSRARTSLETEPVPAFGRITGRRNVLHLYHKLRIGQTRGVPELAPVIEAFRQLGDYTDAELQAAAVSALFTVFIKTESGEMPGPMEPTSETGAKAGDDDIKMGAGAVLALGDDETIETANPGRPNSAYDPFVMSLLRQMGVALELPFELLVMHFTASYSASRAALLQAWKFFRMRRQWLTDSFCTPIYQEWLTEAVLRGRISAPGFMRDPAVKRAYCGAEWIGPSMGQVDPLKEAMAHEIFEDRQWKTSSQVTSELTGGDWEQNFRQRAREEEMRRAAGLSVSEAAAPAQRVLPERPDQADEEDIEE